MPKDIIVYTKIDAKPKPAETLDILLVSTAGEKPLKLYRDMNVIAEDFGADTAVTAMARALWEQPHTLADTLIRKVKMVGFAPPESPAALIAALEALREKDNDWYMLLTDQTGDEYIKALAAWTERTEPTEAELGAGVEDHRKFYFAQTDNQELGVTYPRCALIYTDRPEEHADAAYVGNVGPFFPRSVTWKFKRPDGLTVPDLTDPQRDALEEANVNFLTREYKYEYIKNGVCADGNFIDVQLGADYITNYMRDELYRVRLENPKISYTDAGFAQIATAIYNALNRATTLGIIALDPESKIGVYTVRVPKRADCTDEEARARRMPDIVWEAVLDGDVHSVKVTGRLSVSLSEQTAA